jgi:hypothetical protein
MNSYIRMLFTLRKKDNPTICTTWTNLENIMLSDKPDAERQVLHEFIDTWNLKRSNSGSERRMMVTRAWTVEEEGKCWS